MKHKKYQVYVRNDWPLPFVEPWAWGPTNIAKPPFQWDTIFVIKLGKKYAWCYFEEEVQRLGYEIDAHLSVPKNLRTYSKQADASVRTCNTFIRSCSRVDFTKKTFEELVLLLKEWNSVYISFTAAFMPIDATDETLEEDIRKALRESGHDISFQQLADLLTPDALSYIQREHADFLKLARQFSTSKNKEENQQRMEEHISKWWWTVMGWGQHKPMEKKYLLQKIESISNMNELLAVQKNEQQARRRILKRKKEILQKTTAKVRHVLKAYEMLAVMHDVRKEIQMKMMTLGFGLTEQILKRKSVPLKYRNFILLDEYFTLNKSSELLEELEKRKGYYWYEVNSGNRSLMLSGEDALKKIRESGIDPEEASYQHRHVTGMPASPGRVVGKVRNELDAVAANKVIQEGEILITSQTTPDFAPSMKKSAAIVTDEGGITSHAAIVSRELGIPCIIGTKIATKVFKTGDRVEVDADNGIVKKV